jgi:hypothetical protein
MTTGTDTLFCYLREIADAHLVGLTDVLYLLGRVVHLDVEHFDHPRVLPLLLVVGSLRLDPPLPLQPPSELRLRPLQELAPVAHQVQNGQVQRGHHFEQLLKRH